MSGSKCAARSRRNRFMQSLRPLWLDGKLLIAEAMQAELMTLVQIALWGACLGALPWLAMELAGWTISAFKVAGPMTAFFAGMIPKLDNAFAAIDKGVKKVIIGRAENLESLISGEKGTQIHA